MSLFQPVDPQQQYMAQMSPQQYMAQMTQQEQTGAQQQQLAAQQQQNIMQQQQAQQASMQPAASNFPPNSPEGMNKAIPDALSPQQQPPWHPIVDKYMKMFLSKASKGGDQQ